MNRQDTLGNPNRSSAEPSEIVIALANGRWWLAPDPSACRALAQDDPRFARSYHALLEALASAEDDAERSRFELALAILWLRTFGGSAGPELARSLDYGSESPALDAFRVAMRRASTLHLDGSPELSAELAREASGLDVWSLPRATVRWLRSAWSGRVPQPTPAARPAAYASRRMADSVVES